MNIEFVHYFGESSDRFYAKNSVCTKVSKNIVSENSESRTSFPQINQNYQIDINELEKQSSNGKRRKKIPYSVAEIICLVRGINKHAVGSWANILLDKEFCFESTRTGTDLKDKFRNLKNNRSICIDRRQGFQFEKYCFKLKNEIMCEPEY